MKLFIYLLKRDKKGIKIITILEGHACPPKRLDLKHLDVPAPIKTAVQQCIHDNRMNWEPWIESSESISSLLQSIEKRGYVNKQMKILPEISLKAIESDNNLTWNRKLDKTNIKRISSSSSYKST